MNINVDCNFLHFNLEDLMVVGKRANNPKRNFLFISKVLGKHLDVTPDVCKAAGFLLSSIAYGHDHQRKFVAYLKHQDFDVKPYFTAEDTGSKVLVIGFAETATGLGMSAAAAIKNSTFYTTTREDVDLQNLLTFEEEHSHATTHKMYSIDTLDFSQFDEIALVDDEITTGNSMLNLIRELHKKSGVKNYRILTILDWRGQEHWDKFNQVRKELGIRIDVNSILSGSFSSEDDTVYTGDEEHEIVSFTNAQRWELPKLPRHFCSSNGKMKSFLRDTGRFGIQHDSFARIEDTAKEIAEVINNRLGTNKKILVVGHGENIYIPSRIASYLQGDVKFRTTTRSPIFVDGEIIQSRHYFMDNGVKYYFYNAGRAEADYDYVLFLNEFDLSVMLTKNTTVFKL